MPRQPRQDVPTRDYRRKIIGAPVSRDEQREFLAAAKRSGYKKPGTCAREILLAWARGELIRAPVARTAPAIEDVRATLERAGKL